MSIERRFVASDNDTAGGLRYDGVTHVRLATGKAEALSSAVLMLRWSIEIYVQCSMRRGGFASQRNQELVSVWLLTHSTVSVLSYRSLDTSSSHIRDKRVPFSWHASTHCAFGTSV